MFMVLFISFHLFSVTTSHIFRLCPLLISSISSFKTRSPRIWQFNDDTNGGGACVAGSIAQFINAEALQWNEYGLSRTNCHDIYVNLVSLFSSSSH